MHYVVLQRHRAPSDQQVPRWHLHEGYRPTQKVGRHQRSQSTSQYVTTLHQLRHARSYGAVRSRVCSLSLEFLNKCEFIPHELCMSIHSSTAMSINGGSSMGTVSGICIINRSRCGGSLVNHRRRMSGMIIRLCHNVIIGLCYDMIGQCCCRTGRTTNRVRCYTSWNYKTIT